MELIVVITILAILSVIGFVSFLGYFSQTRDSVRVADIKTIHTGLTLFQVQSGKYPLPENFIEVMAGGEVLTYQGEIGENLKTLLKVQGKATDPKDTYNYTYVVDKNQQKAELLGYLEEGHNIQYISFLENIYADYSQRKPYVYGDKVGVITDANFIPLGRDDVSGNRVNILDEIGDLTTYFGGNVYDGGKTNATGSTLAAKFNQSLAEVLPCSSSHHDGYDIDSLSHGETGNFTKTVSVNHGTQIHQLSVQCINGDVDFSSGETIVGTTCTTAGYVSFNNTCVENACQGSIPGNATSTALSSDHQTSWSYSTTPGVCSFECNQNYTYSYETHTCVENTQDGIQCAPIPDNASYNTVNTITQTWNGTTWAPSNTSQYSTNASMQECRFQCNAGYTYNEGSNMCIGNTCTTPATDTHNSQPYDISSSSIQHGNETSVSGTRNFGAGSNAGSIEVTFTYSCNAGVRTKENSIDSSGTCGAGYVFNNDFSNPACSQIINATCGTSNGTATLTAPSTNLCGTGTSSSVTSNAGTFTWSCSGVNGGTNASCSAPRQYMVTFDGNSGSGHTPANKAVTHNTAVGTLPSNPSRSGYIFNVWKTSTGTTISTSTVITGPVTYYADWIASNCSATTIGGYSVPATNHGGTTAWINRTASITGGTQTYTNRFTCNTGLFTAQTESLSSVSCSGGYYLVNGTTCVVVGTGYYSPGGTNTRTACPTGLTTTTTTSSASSHCVCPTGTRFSNEAMSCMPEEFEWRVVSASYCPQPNELGDFIIDMGYTTAGTQCYEEHQKLLRPIFANCGSNQAYEYLVCRWKY